MPNDEVVHNDGPIFRLVTQRVSWHETDFWQHLREACEQMTDARLTFTAIETDLERVIEQEGELREDSPEERLARFEASKAGVAEPGHIVSIPGEMRVAAFPEEPSFRVRHAIDTLHKLKMARQYVAQHSSAGFAFILGCRLGTALEQIRIMQYEPDTALGQQHRAHLRDIAKKRRDKNLSRDATIRAQHARMRSENPRLENVEIYRQLAVEHGISSERVRQIVKE